MSERKDATIKAPLIRIVVGPGNSRKDVVIEAPAATAAVKAR